MSMSEERIAEKYYPDIYKFCCAKCRNENVAQDITQETFLLFINKFDELTDINIRSWLLSVANNKLREYFRKSQIENTFVCVDNVEISTFDSYEYDKIDVDELFDDVQKKILNILNDKEKELFIKLYIEKENIDLIAKELDITYGNLRTRKSRLKNKTMLPFWSWPNADSGGSKSVEELKQIVSWAQRPFILKGIILEADCLLRSLDLPSVLSWKPSSS